MIFPGKYVYLVSMYVTCIGFGIRYAPGSFLYISFFVVHESCRLPERVALPRRSLRTVPHGTNSSGSNFQALALAVARFKRGSRSHLSGSRAPLRSLAMSKGAVAERASQPTHRDELADWTRTGCRDSCACRVSLSAARGEGDVSGDVEAERS